MRPNGCWRGSIKVMVFDGLYLARIKRSEVDVPHIAVGICHTGESTHTGIVHRDPDGAVRFLHQGFHYCTRNEPVGDSVAEFNGLFLFVVPNLEADRARNVAGLCRLIARRLTDNNLPGFPYSLRLDDEARFDEHTGLLALANGVGLSCSTFVILVFRSARIRFIDFDNWRIRDGDIDAQRRLVGILEGWQAEGRASRDHVDAVRSEIGCVRARPEEVAGICATELPGRFDVAQRAGVAVLAALNDLRNALS